MKKLLFCFLLVSSQVFSDVPLKVPSWLVGCWVEVESEKPLQKLFNIVDDVIYFKIWSGSEESDYGIRNGDDFYLKFQNTYSNDKDYSRYTLNAVLNISPYDIVFADINFSQGKEKDVIGVSGLLPGLFNTGTTIFINKAFKRSNHVVCNTVSSVN